MLIKQNLNSIRRGIKVNTLVAATMTAGLVFAAVPASAYVPTTDTVKISINAVDLETEAGVQRIYEYMSQQAESSCDYSNRTSLDTRRIQSTCAATLLDSFVEDLNDARITAYHNRQIAS